jgi:signal transduction histidine kinase
VEPRPGRRDVWLPGLALVAGVVELALLATPGWVVAAALEAVAAALLVFRRTHPLLAFPAAAVVLMTIPLTGTHMEEAATPIVFYVLGTYSLARYAPRFAGVVAVAVTVLLVLVDGWQQEGSSDVTDVVFVLAMATPPFVFGRVTRRLAEQSAEIARQAEQIRHQAVRAERDRIARELHDVIAHSVSAMVVQTAAAQDLVRTSPDRALALLGSVAETGRRALAETGQLLHVVRDESDELGLRPAPGLADLPALLSEMRSAGLEVDATVNLPVEPLPGGADVSAYRVVREVLTNALRYGDGSARLVVEAVPDGLTISCSNPVGRPSPVPGSGFGLTGVAERVELLGGTLRHGRSGEQFRVDAHLPLVTAAAP